MMLLNSVKMIGILCICMGCLCACTNSQDSGPPSDALESSLAEVSSDKISSNVEASHSTAQSESSSSASEKAEPISSVSSDVSEPDKVPVVLSDDQKRMNLEALESYCNEHLDKSIFGGTASDDDYGLILYCPDKNKIEQILQSYTGEPVNITYVETEFTVQILEKVVEDILATGILQKDSDYPSIYITTNHVQIIVDGQLAALDKFLKTYRYAECVRVSDMNAKTIPAT